MTTSVETRNTITSRAPDAGWRVLIVDDEPGVHEVTRLALGGLSFEDQTVCFLSAYSSEQARQMIEQQPDIAVVLLDVVMEHEQAGLELVRIVRQEIGNRLVRIVLRTGQPGSAPEQKVVREFDINDYLDKVELTASRLTTSVLSSLRCFRDLIALEQARQGLEGALRVTANVVAQRSFDSFGKAVLNGLGQLGAREHPTVMCRVSPHAESGKEILIAAAEAGSAQLVGAQACEVLPEPQVQLLQEAATQGRTLFSDNHYALHLTGAANKEGLLFTGTSGMASCPGRDILQLFSWNVAVTHENIRLNEEVVSVQAETIWLLAGAAETRSKETGNHVKRVGLLSQMLALAIGCDPETANAIGLAAPLHDIGKIGIPDSVLNKPGPHTPAEAEIMRSHTRLGAELLAPSKCELLKLAATIALEHHESWDGTGYPNRRRGEDISLAGRIVALVDVYDALGSARCYKSPWNAEQIRGHLIEATGKKFDPALVALLLTHWEQAQTLRQTYPD